MKKKCKVRKNKILDKMKVPHKLLYGDSIPYSLSSGKLVPPFQKWWDFSPRVSIVDEPGEVDGEALYPAQALCGLGSSFPVHSESSALVFQNHS